jgi:predicted phosphoribosyltransferase
LKPVCYDRSDAGLKLAEMLERHQGGGVLVLAIPSGGVPVAAEIARALALPLDVAPVSKVLFPWTTESGYGAVAFDGSVWIDDAAVHHCALTREQVERGIAEARSKVEPRVVRLRGRASVCGACRTDGAAGRRRHRGRLDHARRDRSAAQAGSRAYQRRRAHCA